jgi:hypothetical protein
MRWPLLSAVVLAGSASVASAEIQVHVTNGRVNLQATAAPLSEVLDRLAKQTGMKVTYDGSPQRVPVNLTLTDRTPAQAVLGVLDGLGLNYALRMDLTGTRVETLMIAGSTSAAPAGTAPTPPRPVTPVLRPSEPVVEPDEEAQAEEDGAEADEPPDTEAQPPAGVVPPLGQQPPGTPGATVLPGVPNPAMQGVPKPPPGFPSPFAPPTPSFPGSQPPAANAQQPPAEADDSTQ